MSTKPLRFPEPAGRTARTRKRIQDAARHAFSERGTAVQIDDVIRIAGVARGTFYNYFQSVEELFEHVAAEMARDMGERIHRRLASHGDAAVRIANGVRHFCLRAHQERDWGLFLAHFGLSAETLQIAIRETALLDIESGTASGRFRLRPDQAMSALALLSGATLAAMKLIISGVEAPQRAGETVAELTLRALGVEPSEAAALASSPLIPLND
jgi:AcrR family transcriptional regulator